MHQGLSFGLDVAMELADVIFQSLTCPFAKIKFGTGNGTFDMDVLLSRRALQPLTKSIRTVIQVMIN